MASRVHGEDTTLKLYVERAIPDASGNRIFESDPEEFVLFDGFHTEADFYNEDVEVIAMGHAVYISGYCKGANRNAGGYGSIISYLIGGLKGYSIDDHVEFATEAAAAGIVTPLPRSQDGVPVWHRTPSTDIAFIIADTVNVRLKIVTTKHPLLISETGIIDHPLENDGLSLTFDERSAGKVDFSRDDGTIPFEDFMFFGNYQTHPDA